MYETKTMHLFAGHGGGLLADLILGHTPIVAVEWDKYACQVLRERAADGWFPDLSVWEGDVRLFDPSEYTGKVDCIHAGFPCQDISVAGRKEGVSESTRSGLYREVLRISSIVRPKYIFLENVGNITNNGIGVVLGDLSKMGYDAKWCCVHAEDVGAPHKRERWFALAYPKCIGSQGQGKFEQPKHTTEEKIGETVKPINGCKSNFWSTEPAVGRVANGVPHRVHRLKGLGNAQVPLQAALAFKLLKGK